MSINDIALFIGFVALIVTSALYSGFETGIYVLNSARVQLMGYAGDRRARFIIKMKKHPEILLATILIGTNVSNYLLASFATSIVGHHTPEMEPFYLALITTIILQPFVLIFAEMTPKNIFRKKPNYLVMNSMNVLKISWYAFLPASYLIKIITTSVSFLIGKKPPVRENFWSLKSIQEEITEGVAQGALTRKQNLIATNILGLSRATAKSAMTPIDRVVLVSEDSTFSDVFKKAAENRYSRYPVFSGKPDKISGVVNIFDPLYKGKLDPVAIGMEPIKEHMTSPIFIKGDTGVDQAFATLRAKQSQMGIITDIGGTPIGIITMKDLLDKIVGELPVW